MLVAARIFQEVTGQPVDPAKKPRRRSGSGLKRKKKRPNKK